MTLKKFVLKTLQIQHRKVQEVSIIGSSSGDETSMIVSDEEIDKQKLGAHSSYMAKIQEVSPDESSSTSQPLEQIPYDTSDPANRFCPNGEETVTLEKESRSKLDKDTDKPYDYTYQNSLYETFKPPSKTYLDQLERAKELEDMWRKL
ncbi:hypothetical protein Tco_0858756 [Tanacetum coccineum]|uniref:Uncharacterized protein n=1 Tax=Tanacetum coccineum TaxID=301880 RepID=A0ABQ5BE19_9ASTR